MSAWRLEFALEADAQTLADRVHAFMIANNRDYARSVGRGQTLRWAFPYQDQIPTVWSVNIKDRSFASLTGPERSAVVILRP